MTDDTGSNSIPDGLRAAGRKRTDDVFAKLRAALLTMESEILSNSGLYPGNRGRINQAEVCRRAGVSKITLQGALHKTTSKVEVDEWVAKWKNKRAPEVRREITTRAEQWKEEHEKIASKYALAMLELNEAENKVQRLEMENQNLREQLETATLGKIIAFPRRD